MAILRGLLLALKAVGVFVLTYFLAFWGLGLLLAFPVLMIASVFGIGPESGIDGVVDIVRTVLALLIAVRFALVFYVTRRT